LGGSNILGIVTQWQSYNQTRPLLAHEKQIRDKPTADGTLSTAFHTNVAETTAIQRSYHKLCGTRT